MAIALPAVPATAQMQLPGALNGQSGGAPPGEAGVPHMIKPVVVKPPSADTIVGPVLKYDGKTGAMVFARSGADLTLTKLTLAGDKISKPTQSCSADVALPTPVAAQPLGHPVGAERYDVPVPVCPFSIDVLDGAVLVSPAEASCEIPAADCRVSATGLWGPTAAEISPERAQAMEHDRVRLETTMRTDFRALLARAGKDRAAVKAIAADQAGFSSDREVTCRDYDQESVLGFCSTQITEARVLALIAKFGPAAVVRERKPKVRPKAAEPAAPAPAAAAAPAGAAQ